MYIYLYLRYKYIYMNSYTMNVQNINLFEQRKEKVRLLNKIKNDIYYLGLFFFFS